MDIIPHLENLLHLAIPFHITNVRNDEEKKEVYIYVEVQDSYRPVGMENSRIHSYKARTWEHLNLFEIDIL